MVHFRQKQRTQRIKDYSTVNTYEYEQQQKQQRRAKRNRKQADTRKQEYGKQRLTRSTKRGKVQDSSDYEDTNTA